MMAPVYLVNPLDPEAGPPSLFGCVRWPEGHACGKPIEIGGRLFPTRAIVLGPTAGAEVVRVEAVFARPADLEVLWRSDLFSAHLQDMGTIYHILRS